MEKENTDIENTGKENTDNESAGKEDAGRENSRKDITILAVESSCDETAAAVVRNGREVLSNIISSQIDLHTLYGGVVVLS